MHQVAAACAPHDEQAGATLEMIRAEARTRFGIENVEHLADRVQAREQVSAEVSRPAHEAQQLRERATVLDAEATWHEVLGEHWSGREADPDTTEAAGEEGAPKKVSVAFYESQAAHARSEAERLRTQAAELEDPARQAERLRALGRAAEAIEQHPDWGQDEAATAGDVRDQAHTRQIQGEAYRDHAAALELEAAPSPDVERQAMIAQSIEGITETDAVTARKIAATANAHPARMAASVPTKAPKARTHGAGRDRQVTMGR